MLLQDIFIIADGIRKGHSRAVRVGESSRIVRTVRTMKPEHPDTPWRTVQSILVRRKLRIVKMSQDTTGVYLITQGLTDRSRQCEHRLTGSALESYAPDPRG